MATAAKERRMERKTIRISSKRQVTIPQRYFDRLGFGEEAECILREDELVIRPVRAQSGGEFSEQILADLIAQGYSGEQLLEQFKAEQKKVRPAVERMIEKADALAARLWMNYLGRTEPCMSCGTCPAQSIFSRS